MPTRFGLSNNLFNDILPLAVLPSGCSIALAQAVFRKALGFNANPRSGLAHDFFPLRRGFLQLETGR